MSGALGLDKPGPHSGGDSSLRPRKYCDAGNLWQLRLTILDPVGLIFRSRRPVFTGKAGGILEVRVLFKGIVRLVIGAAEVDDLAVDTPEGPVQRLILAHLDIPLLWPEHKASQQHSRPQDLTTDYAENETSVAGFVGAISKHEPHNWDRCKAVGLWCVPKHTHRNRVVAWPKRHGFAFNRTWWADYALWPLWAVPSSRCRCSREPVLEVGGARRRAGA
jgi:hypothetical protein